jgi:hypothetical protein
MSTFTSTTDRQLWVHDEPAFSWSLWAIGGTMDGQDVWLVTLPYAQTMPREVRDKVTDYIYSGSLTKDRFNMIVLDAYLRDYASPRHGTNPSFWNRHGAVNAMKPVEVKADLKPINDNVENEEAREVSDERFLKMAWKMSPVSDYRTFRLVWLAICQAMPHRLLVDMVPVDFGWAKIHAFPYRKNWKQIVLSRVPNFLEQMKEVTGNTLYQKALNTDLPAVLRNTVLVALEKDDHAKHKFGWTLEVEESAEFDKWAKNAEIERHKDISRKDYAIQWASIINKQATDIFKCWYRFVRQTTTPAAHLGKGDVTSCSGLVPYIASRRSRPARVDDVPVDPVYPEAGELRDDTGRRVVVGKAPKMQSLPVLRSVPAYLREPGGSDSSLQWAGSGENRMLVLDSARSEGRSQDVLAQVAGGCGGLERVVGHGDVAVIVESAVSPASTPG